MFTGFFALIVLGVFGAIVSATIAIIEMVVTFFSTPLGMSIFGLVCAVGAFAIFRSHKANLLKALEQKVKAEALAERMNAVLVSDNRTDYLIDGTDYRRGNAKENAYRKVMLLKLLDVFGNQCAKCSAKDNGIDLDHFIISKNEGGSFVLRHRDGYLVNNALPLCRSCNSSKSDKSYKTFFTESERLNLFEKNVLLTRHLNELNFLDEDGKPSKQKKNSA